MVLCIYKVNIDIVQGEARVASGHRCCRRCWGHCGGVEEPDEWRCCTTYVDDRIQPSGDELSVAMCWGVRVDVLVAIQPAGVVELSWILWRRRCAVRINIPIQSVGAVVCCSLPNLDLSHTSLTLIKLTEKCTNIYKYNIILVSLNRP